MNKEIITIIFWREMKGGVLVELFKKTADKNKMLLFPCLDSQNSPPSPGHVCLSSILL